MKSKFIDLRHATLFPDASVPLHPAFVELIRHAWETGRIRSGFAGALYWSTEPPWTYRPPASEMKRLRRLAVTLNYHGSILDEGRS